MCLKQCVLIGRIAFSALIVGGWLISATTVAIADDERKPYLLELYTPSAARLYAEKKAAGVTKAERSSASTARIAEIEDEQQTFVANLSTLIPTLQVSYTLKRVMNGVVVMATHEELTAVADLVRAVYPVPICYPSLDTSTPYIQAPSVWDILDEQDRRITGEGIRIAIVDTGIDYTNPTFGGDVFTTWNSSGPTTAKIVGGVDLVGDNYVPGDTSTLLRDPDPMDQHGHGTHVAGIAAGYGAIDDGTSGLQNDVWRSSNGTDWTEVTPTAPWPKHWLHTSEVFQEKMYVLGGSKKVTPEFSDDIDNDVWRSNDGETWEKVLSFSRWSNRYGHTSLIFDGKIWVIGGLTIDYPTTKRYAEDVWSSLDGEEWERELIPTPWGGRYRPSSVVHDGKMWIMAGSYDGERMNDIWSSTNGVDWSLVLENAPWSERINPSVLSFENKLWVFGGNVLFATTSDIWYSEDGITWHQETEAAPWESRGDFLLYELGGRHWLFGGNVNGNENLLDRSDIWSGLWQGTELGFDWVQELETVPWRPRRGHASAMFNGQIYVLGGKMTGGTQQVGGYSSGLYPLDETFIIGPGVAPGALLYGVKIFGPHGGTAHVPEGIEWCLDPNEDGDLDDHMDIINLSLGSDYGSSNDAVSVAVTEAVTQTGCLIVAAAGNAYDAHMISSSPANSPHALSVAAVHNEVPETGYIADFSSRGPTTSTSGEISLKPDITAPGVDIFASFLRSSQFDIGKDMSGTSMAAPHVAGAAALLMQQRPNRELWGPGELKSLLMNTAKPSIFRADGATRTDPARSGAGLADIVKAASVNVIAYNAENKYAVSVSFKMREVTGTQDERRTIKVKNLGNVAMALNVAIDPISQAPGTTVEVVENEQLVLAAESAVEFDIRLQANASQMRNQHAPGLVSSVDFQDGLEYPRASMSEIAGFIIFSKGTEEIIRLPYYGMVRPISHMRSNVQLIDFSEGNFKNINLEGTGLYSGENPPEDTLSLVSPFELLFARIDNSMYEDERLRAGEVQYLGVRSDYREKLLELGDEALALRNTTIYFGIGTYGEWRSPHPSNVSHIVNIVGTDTHSFLANIRLRNWAVQKIVDYGGIPLPIYSGDAFLATTCDTFVSGNCAQDPGQFLAGLSHADYDARPFFSNVMVLPVSAERIGLTDPLDTRLHFTLESIVSRASDQELHIPDAEDAFFVYEVTNPGVSFSGATEIEGSSAFHDLPGNSIIAEISPNAFGTNGFVDPQVSTDPQGSLGVLLLHHHNEKDFRSERLWVSLTTDTDHDTIPDLVEGVADFDGDGLVNFQDTDSDNDGIGDQSEGSEDSDGDGAPNFVDLDADGDGLGDALEGNDDFDSDGHPNFLDTDSDSDGIGDAIEGGSDSDNDGYRNFIDLDSDGDTISDESEGAQDADGDGVANFLDSDSDGDTLPDNIEKNSDFDADSIPNFLDLDADNDGIADIREREWDADGDGQPNYLDTDSDGDGILDENE